MHARASNQYYIQKHSLGIVSEGPYTGRTTASEYKSCHRRLPETIATDLCMADQMAFKLG